MVEIILLGWQDLCLQFPYRCITYLIFEQACDHKAVADHVSTPTTIGVLRTNVGIRDPLTQ